MVVIAAGPQFYSLCSVPQRGVMKFMLEIDGGMKFCLITLAKVLQREESISPSSFYGNCPTINQTCYVLSSTRIKPCLPSKRVFLCVPGVAERNKNAGQI